VRRASLSSLQVLVLVACHAVFTGHDYTRHQEFDSWFLLDYQKVCPLVIGRRSVSLLAAITSPRRRYSRSMLDMLLVVAAAVQAPDPE
jgi:hypothetical protein